VAQSYPGVYAFEHMPRRGIAGSYLFLTF
jgi:hypothetical protein